jgi:phosphatidate phosphatase APP1
MKTVMQFLLPLLLVTTACGQTSNVKSDQTIVFFPGIGHRVENGTAWELEILGCVYEPEKRALSLLALRAALGLDHVKMDATELATFKERARLFLVDNKRGRKVLVRIGNRDFLMAKSKSNGHFNGTVRLTEEEVAQLRPKQTDNRIEFQATTKDGRLFKGVVDLMANTGITVISDIDDTIKISEVLRRNQMLRRTFLEPFQPVPGMPEVYQSWVKVAETQFHYVSASPWQLYLPLTDFIRSNGFPAGTFHLQPFRAMDKSFFNLFASPETYKVRTIEPLLKKFPDRRFVLVGDSGQRDPEAYATLARKYPQQVMRIFIRNVTGEGPDAARFQKIFSGLPPTLWKVFDNPVEIQTALD